MRGKFADLKRGPFDLLVVGGGIYGAWTAYDAALRGLQVALIERTDWAASTSSASSKLIHGGLRYLEHFEFGLVRKSLAERKLLARLAPHRVRPLRFGLPVRRGARVGRFRLRAGLWLYDRLAGSDQPVAGHQSLSRKAWSERYPFLVPQDLTGGFTYGDAQTDDARMTLEIVDGASTAGAVTVTGVEAVAWKRTGSRVHGATLRELATGESFDLEATVIADCGGPWSGLLNAGEGPAYRMSKGVHLLMPALPSEDAFLLNSDDDARIVFLIPWHGHTLLGTTDTDYQGDPAMVRPEPEDEAYLLERANRYLRAPGWTADDVLGQFSGLRVLPAGDDDSPSALSREWILSQPLEGLLSAVGGKYTSARADAAQTVDAALKFCRKPARPCATEERLFPWAPTEPFETWAESLAQRGRDVGLDEATARGVAVRYGRRAPQLLDRIQRDPEAAQRILAPLPYCWAELDFAAETEGAKTLTDLLRRRLPLVLLYPLEHTWLEQCAHRAAGVLGWDPNRVAQEIERVLHPDTW